MSIHCVAWPRNRSVTVRLLAALALLAVGCGDDSHRLGGASENVSSPKGMGLCAEGAAFESIDQMEDGDSAIEETAKRSGTWFPFNDKTSTQVPDPYAKSYDTFKMSELDPPRAGSSYFAVHTSGGGFTDWGAGMGLELRNQQAYDLSSYAGVTFWARRAPNTSATLRFSLPDLATAKRGGQCEGNACDNYFGTDLNLSTAFHRYSFTWQELKQEDWGDPQPALNTKQVYGIRFQVDPFEDFDFWIDDVALICNAP